MGSPSPKELGGRAVRPTALIDPGPHVEAGRYITFWTYRTGSPASASQAGAALRVADLIGGEAGEILRDAASRMMPPALPQQAIHGDAHFENCLAGGTWQDFDEACLGPCEWNLASMIHRWTVFGELERDMRSALVAYGAHDVDAVDALQPLVVLAIAAWGSLAPLIGELSSPRTARRLEWLRRH